MSEDLKNRIVQFLKDQKVLLYHWQAQIEKCPDCSKLQDETSPSLAGLNGLLKELGVER